MMANVTGGTAPGTSIKNPGGVKAPSGRSVAAGQLKRREAGRRYTLRTRREAKERRPSAPRGGGKKPSVPYNALESPYKTQGQFNQAVARVAKPEYEPDLTRIGTDEQGET